MMKITHKENIKTKLGKMLLAATRGEKRHTNNKDRKQMVTLKAKSKTKITDDHR